MRGRPWGLALGALGPGLSRLPALCCRMQGAGKALHELLVAAQRRGGLTAGVYESAKLMNV